VGLPEGVCEDCDREAKRRVLKKRAEVAYRAAKSGGAQIRVFPMLLIDEYGQPLEELVRRRIPFTFYYGEPAQDEKPPTAVSPPAEPDVPRCCLCDAVLRGDDRHDQQAACWPCRSRLSDAEPFWLRFLRWLVR
jgi:hypothetical protein